MALTVRELIAPSTLIHTIKPQMQALRAAYEGGPAFKNSVLVKRPSEDAALFRDKLMNVASLPICKAIVDEIVDVVFETPPTRHPAFLTYPGKQDAGVPDWYHAFCEDADLNGNSLTACMEMVAAMAGIEGWAWVFVDLPEQESKANRPYISFCTAEHVIDWKIFTEYGKDYFEYIKVIEYQDQEMTIYKVWYSGDAKNPTYCERYFVSEGMMNDMDQEIFPEETYQLPMGLPIPVVQVIARQDQRRNDLGVSDLTEANDVQREMLKLEAEAYDSIRFSKPMIRAAAGIRIPAGGGGIIRGDKDQVEVFEIPVQDLAQIRAQQESLIERLDGFLGRGGLRTTRMQSQSGISIIEERRALHRKAAQRARQLESAEQEIHDLVSCWMDLYWAGDIDYETDYEDKDTQFRMALLQTAAQLSANNPVVQEIIDREVIKMIAPPDQTAEYLARVGLSNTTEPNNASDYTQGDGYSLTQEQMRENIYSGEIQDKGVTTNDPIARQLVMLGVGR
jgi:hypothetical protein